MTSHQTVRVEVVQSFADGGYYAEVWEQATGREVYSSDIWPDLQGAIKQAQDWARTQGYAIA